jgi:SNF2 family DNA or RNA helicase
MEVIDNTALRIVVPTGDVPSIKNHIERCEVLQSNTQHSELLVYWGINEMQRLARLYADIPSPIERDYKWPGLYKPFKHQRVTAAFLSMRDRAFCFNEAGTGKTSSVVWAADYLMQEKQIRRVLIICPLSIMYSAWQDDIFKTAMHRTAAVAHGDTKKRQKVIRGEYEFVVINYDGVGTVEDDIKASGFDLIVIDEANAYKNTSTKRWKTLNRLLTPSTRLWMLTGTPASQSPEDAFGLAKLICPGNVPKWKTTWKEQVMYQVSRFRWLPKANSRKLVYQALQPAIRFEKSQCLDLPSVTYQTRHVALTAQVARYYKLIKDQMLVETAGVQITAVNAAAKVSKLLQISGGAVYAEGNDIVEFDIGPRLDTLLEVLEETEHKVIVFVPFRHTIELVSKFLTSKGVTNEIISGDVTARNRADIISRFQKQTDPRVLVIQPQAASHGVTLTAADTVVFWSPVTSVETYLQCIARIDRVGQQNKMTVVHLQGSAIERQMYTMLRNKVDLHSQLVDLYKQELENE